MPSRYFPWIGRGWILRGGAGLTIGSLLVVGCSGTEGEVDQPTAETATVAPTTSLVIEFIDASGLPFCDVAGQVAGAIRVFSDSSSNYGDAETIKDTYVEALKAFDALEQVATREIVNDLGVLTVALSDAVSVAAEAGWDLTAVSDDAAAGVESDEVAMALAHVRRYTSERCGLEVLGIEPPITAGPDETPAQRLLRVVGETFPVLTDEQAACLAGGLWIDFDPDDPSLDQGLVARAMRNCGIDPEAPSRPTTTVETTTTAG